MTKDTKNRVNTPGGEPEEKHSGSGTSEAENETAEENTDTKKNTENSMPEKDEKCESSKGPEDKSSGPVPEEADEKENENPNGGEPGGREQDTGPQEENCNKENDAASAVIKENEKLKKDLGTVNEQLKKQQNVFLRTVAEYDNYRKRTEREKASVYSDATAAAVKEILSVEDNLARALEQKDCSAEDLRKGVEMVEKQMRKALKKLGVAEMGKEGDPFDPALHNAVSHIEDENAGENTIAEVFQKGYMIGDKVIRHAMVKVAN